MAQKGVRTSENRTAVGIGVSRRDGQCLLERDLSERCTVASHEWSTYKQSLAVEVYLSLWHGGIPHRAASTMQKWVASTHNISNTCTVRYLGVVIF